MEFEFWNDNWSKDEKYMELDLLRQSLRNIYVDLSFLMKNKNFSQEEKEFLEKFEDKYFNLKVFINDLYLNIESVTRENIKPYFEFVYPFCTQCNRSHDSEENKIKIVTELFHKNYPKLEKLPWYKRT